MNPFHPKNCTMKLDIIGDIHGRAHTLERLLKKLGYVRSGRIWKHEERRVLFLGDYIDRGLHPRETLETIRAMVEAGHADAIMGNHEFNAVAYHTPDGKGSHLRPHTDSHTKQHEATLDAFSSDPAGWHAWISWFKELPFFYQAPGMRAVHACWCETSLDLIRGHSLQDADFLSEAADAGTDAGHAIERLLKGPEISVARFGVKIHVPGDHPRDTMRVKWWGYDSSAEAYTLPEISMPAGVGSPQHRVTSSDLRGVPNLPLGGAPVFFGHYRLSHAGGFAPVAPGICCLDYGAGSGGALVAYRWDGEQELHVSKFVSQPDCDGPGE